MRDFKHPVAPEIAGRKANDLRPRLFLVRPAPHVRRRDGGVVLQHGRELSPDGCEALLHSGQLDHLLAMHHVVAMTFILPPYLVQHMAIAITLEN